MKKLSVSALALVLAASTFAGAGAFSTAALAEVYTAKKYVNRDVCYKSRRVPATYAYDTKGIKVSGASRSWQGNMQRDGAHIRNRYNDEVYIQTETMIEDQHITLVPVPCR